MDEYLLLLAFNAALLGIISVLAYFHRIIFYQHLIFFAAYNVLFGYLFFYRGQYGQGFAWLFLNAIVSIAYFLFLMYIFVSSLIRKRNK